MHPKWRIFLILIFGLFNILAFSLADLLATTDPTDKKPNFNRLKQPDHFFKYWHRPCYFNNVFQNEKYSILQHLFCFLSGPFMPEKKSPRVKLRKTRRKASIAACFTGAENGTFFS